MSFQLRVLQLVENAELQLDAIQAAELSVKKFITGKIKLDKFLCYNLYNVEFDLAFNFRSYATHFYTLSFVNYNIGARLSFFLFYILLFRRIYVNGFYGTYRKND